MRVITEAKAHRGVQGVYAHASVECACDMTFAVFTPDQARTAAVPVLWFLSGLTCTPANVVEKGEYRRLASELGMMVVCPDTSPRGEHVPDEKENWQFGLGAGFYVDATQAPFSTNYRMYSYVLNELPALIAQNFPADMSRQGVFGHSMGGHGALVLALRNPDRYGSCSAFAPIVQPTTATWSKPALEKYLGPEPQALRAWDAVALVEDGYRFNDLLIDQGTADGFLQEGLRPWLLDAACKQADIRLRLRMQDGYDHSYNFISTFMDDHILWHAVQLAG